MEFVYTGARIWRATSRYLFVLRLKTGKKTLSPCKMSHLDGRISTLTTQQTETTRRELSVQETKKAFIEPEISSPVDVLEATAFFQVIVGPTDVTGDLGT